MTDDDNPSYEQTVEMLLTLPSNETFVSITGPYEERTGERATVLGVALVTTPYVHRRPCFYVRYADEHEDYLPIESANKFMQVYTD